MFVASDNDMNMKEVKKGFVPVMLLPFKDSGEIDYPGLRRLTEFYLEAGAKGLFANCLSSEMFALSPQERLAATRYIVETVDGRVPVIASGTFEGSVDRQADFVKAMYDTGVQAVIIITSMMAAADEPDTIFSERVFTLLNQTENIPLGFYECPMPYKRIISPALLKQFVSTGRIIYHKDTCLDIDLVRAKIAVGHGYAFGLYDAYMAHAVASLTAGAAGLSCIQGNYFPELIVWLCDYYNVPAYQAEVQRLQHFLIEKMDIMHSAYPASAKYYLQKRGLAISTITRENNNTLTSEVRKGIDSFYAECIAFQEEVDIELVI